MWFQRIRIVLPQNKCGHEAVKGWHFEVFVSLASLFYADRAYSYVQGIQWEAFTCYWLSVLRAALCLLHYLEKKKAKTKCKNSVSPNHLTLYHLHSPHHFSHRLKKKLGIHQLGLLFISKLPFCGTIFCCCFLRCILWYLSLVKFGLALLLQIGLLLANLKLLYYLHPPNSCSIMVVIH